MIEYIAGVLIASTPIIITIAFIAWLLWKFPPPMVGRRL